MITAGGVLIVIAAILFFFGFLLAAGGLKDVAGLLVLAFIVLAIPGAILLSVGNDREHKTLAERGWAAIEQNSLNKPVPADHIQSYGSDTELPYFIIKQSQANITKDTPVQFGWIDANGKYNDAELPIVGIGVSLNTNDSAPTVQFLFVGEPGKYRPSFKAIFAKHPSDWVPSDLSPFINTDDVKSMVVTMSVTDYEASPFSDPIIKQLLLFSPK